MRHSGNMGGGGKAKEITSAQEKIPHRQTANRHHTAGVGNERKADVKGVQEGGSAAEAAGNMIHEGLKGAVKELHEQHPHEYHEHGPHHGTTTHMRHEPMHGMKPSRR